MTVVHPTPTTLTTNEHLAAVSYKKAVCNPRAASVWGTRGREFESRRSDHTINRLVASRAKRSATVVRAVVHTRRTRGLPGATPAYERLRLMDFQRWANTGLYRRGVEFVAYDNAMRHDPLYRLQGELFA